MRSIKANAVSKSLLHVVMPLIVGSLLYLLARPKGLVVFDWVRTVGANDWVDAARSVVVPISKRLPSIVLYSLPDGLWVYAFTSAMRLTWSNRWTGGSAPWLLLAPCLGVGSEIGQMIGIVPGTFDLGDLGCLVVASCTALAPLFSSERNRTLVAVAAKTGHEDG